MMLGKSMSTIPLCSIWQDYWPCSPMRFMTKSMVSFGSLGNPPSCQTRPSFSGISKYIIRDCALTRPSMSEREKSNVTPGKGFTHPSEVMLLCFMKCFR
ncbi:hypothetical protein PILCRDRAFT_664297 [Piloderma croceum F 1598]|uniref:Uncharacterized protein n=1 Tax=Piloderma croceum (strain F 1598) TaxID=765440 RepID=A0A0C3APF4_PILCF|nr:hypothetical protein PILCRDRAFT_664297 [Piloderma croceum F 1598]